MSQTVDVSKRKRRVFRVVAILLLLLVVEGLSRIAELALKEFRGVGYAPIRVNDLSEQHRQTLERLLRSDTSYVALSASLGWTIKPGGRARGGMYVANSQGIRSSREFSESSPPAGRVRVTAFGDSFTHCSDVGNAETWEERISELDPTFELINFGVGGYALDQAHLRYLEDGDTYRGAKYALVGFMHENIMRMVNVYRPFYSPDTGLPLSKPRYRLVEGKLELLPNPLRSLDDYRRLLDDPAQVLHSLGRNDYFFANNPRAGAFDFLAAVRLVRLVSAKFGREDDPMGTDSDYQEESEALDLVVAVMARFASDVQAAGATPIVVLFPNRHALGRFVDRTSASTARSWSGSRRSGSARWISWTTWLNPWETVR